MLKKILWLTWLVVILGTACDGGDSDSSNIPSGFNLLTSDCPAQDIIEIPVSEGFAWECKPTDGGEEFIAGTLSDLSQIIDCFSTVSKSDAFCGIAVLGQITFIADHLEFDLENPPPPGELGCNPDIAISEEEVECTLIRLH